MLNDPILKFTFENTELDPWLDTSPGLLMIEEINKGGGPADYILKFRLHVQNKAIKA